MITILQIIALSGALFLLQTLGLLIFFTLWQTYGPSSEDPAKYEGGIIGPLLGGLFGVALGFGPIVLLLFHPTLIFASAEGIALGAFFFLVKPPMDERRRKPAPKAEKENKDLLHTLFDFSAPAPKTSGWKKILAGLSSLFIMACYGLASRSIAGAIADPRYLAQLMQVEFLVIHSFPFICLIALQRPRSWRGKGVQGYLFTALLSLYMLAAGKESVAGVLIFLSATLVTYLGFLLRLRDPGAAVNLLKRWGVSFAFFILWCMILGMESEVSQWRPGDKLFGFGFLYFLSLALAEFTGIYDRSFRKSVPGNTSSS